MLCLGAGGEVAVVPVEPVSAMALMAMLLPLDGMPPG